MPTSSPFDTTNASSYHHQDTLTNGNYHQDDEHSSLLGGNHHGFASTSEERGSINYYGQQEVQQMTPEATQSSFLQWNLKNSEGTFCEMQEREMLKEHEQALAEWELEQKNKTFYQRWCPSFDFMTSCFRGCRGSDENPIVDDGTAELHVQRTDARPQIVPESLKPKKEHKLGELFATAICGNDITSSCLYVIGVCISYAGIWAPICLLMVSFLLFLFRSIYAEVGSAITLNGASYTLLLNTTSKKTASLAACLTIISYIATAVVSGTSAIEYLKNIPYCEHIPLIPSTVILLGIFAFLNLIGISESAFAAAIIFVFHIASLSILTVYGFLYVSATNSFEMLQRNWQLSSASFSALGIVKSIFFGFGAAMLGVTGFESSANFIEQQKPGVFPKTLRNMWTLVSFFNPVLCFISLCALPLSQLTDPKQNASLLSQVGRASAGPWLQILLSFDAALVLSGGVLTAYVGIVGLVRQMSMDRALPAFFLQVNSFRKTNHFIIILFFVLCASMVTILNGDIDALSGVYTIAFLSVMMLFAMGDFLLKYKRGQIKRDRRAKKSVIVIAIIGVGTALLANILENPEYLKYFFIYYAICAVTVLAMFWRVKIMKFIIYLVYSKLKEWNIAKSVTNRILKFLVRQAKDVNSQSFIYFAKNDAISMLNKAVLYVRENELTDWIKIVHVYKTAKSEEEHIEQQKLISRLKNDCKTLDEIYPRMRIDFVAIESEKGFGPDIIRLIESRFGIRKNLMFISCPSVKFKVSDLGGVRIITNDHQN
ncbi:hypothetical protein C9374_011289 [Naegleria lovaniensis]|uniref:Amino acid permease n=1 Tax=Naegleria lovaniensis TaxID=51637 RepID=A0AA88GXV5_NAELO|nr:uncharacterized protein C9374_011289 [Naegleria lovaniensis]KAG2392564.1 hypothetical protein C9374_011289 [Naegleria lovaniensis]